MNKVPILPSDITNQMGNVENPWDAVYAKRYYDGEGKLINDIISEVFDACAKLTDIKDSIKFKGFVKTFDDLPRYPDNYDVCFIINGDSENDVNPGDSVIWLENENRWKNLRGYINLSHLVEKREGYDLSQNDFTDKYKYKLDDIDERANRYIHPKTDATAKKYTMVLIDEYGHVVEGFNPTTLEGYGITDASLKGHTHNDIYYTESEIDSKVNTINTSLNNKSDKTHTHDDRYYTESEINSKLAGKSDTTHTHSQYLTASSDLNVSKLKGVISLDNLPAGALERLVKVTNDTARFALTTNDIQLGDTVKVESTKMMYIVKDITKLNSEDGYEQYTAGMASSVPWSGVTDKPSSYTPSAHTHDDRYYTESEINTKLSGKSDTSHTHDDRYYTESEIDSRVNTINSSIGTKSDKTHTHDDRYYTESEINTKLSGKSDTSHTHNYLPLAGGTITGKVNMKSANLDNLPQVFRTDGVNFAGIRFQNTNGYLGAIGITGNANSVLQRLGANGTLYPILDSSNYNNYSPTKTGGGASGTWGINVSGNSATSTKLNSNGVQTAITAREEAGMYTHKVYNNGYPVSYGNVITVGGDGGGQLLLEWSGDDKGIGHVFYRNRRDCIDSWSDWRMLALTTDNVASATKLATARNFKVNLASTGAASFNGTADATPGVTGTLPIANGGTGATTAAAARSNLGITCANIGAASASHTHGYVPLTGGTINGTLSANNFSGALNGINMVKDRYGNIVFY